MADLITTLGVMLKTSASCLTTAELIKDEALGKKQSELNAEFNSKLGTLQTECQSPINFKGNINDGGDFTTSIGVKGSGVKVGWMYRWDDSDSTIPAANMSSNNVETIEYGDVLLCTTAATSTAGAKFTIVQNNIDGAVTQGGDATLKDVVVSTLNGATVNAGGLATTGGNGLMTAAMVTKLNGLSPYTHPNSGATAGSYGQSANATATWGGTISVPQVTVNAQGHVTAAASRVVTLPSAAATTTTSGLMTAAMVTKLNGLSPYTHPNSGVTAGSYGAEDGWATVNGDEITIPYLTVNAQGHVTAIKNSKFELPQGYSHPNSGATAGSYGQSANATATWGGTISVPQVTVNAQGHVTTAVSRIVTMPSAASTQQAAGLMSAADKKSLDTLVSACKWVTVTQA